jgi:hypothetical protein
MNSASPRRLHRARLLLQPARCRGKLVTGDRQAQHYSVVSSSMAESTTPLAMVQAGHTVRQLLQGGRILSDWLHAPRTAALGVASGTPPHTAASMYRTWLLLLRAVIQLPIMISVCACVSSMGGTGYLQQHRHQNWLLARKADCSALGLY